MYPFDWETLDLITHFSCISAGYDLVCTILDGLSKYLYFDSCPEILSAKSLS